MVTKARAEGFEHGLDGAIFLVPYGSPAVGAGYAIDGAQGVRVGRGGQNDDGYYAPGAVPATDGVAKGCVSGKFKVIQHDTDAKNVLLVNALHDTGGAPPSVAIRRESGPVYKILHGNTAVLTISLSTVYRFRYYWDVDGVTSRTWLWIWDASDVLQVDGNYESWATAATKCVAQVGSSAASGQKINFDAYIDSIGWADDYFTTAPTLTLFHPDVDDGTENDWTCSSGSNKWALIDETVPASDNIFSTTDNHKQLCDTDVNLTGSPTHISVGLGEYMVYLGGAGVTYFIRMSDGGSVAEASYAAPFSQPARVLWQDTAPSGGPWTPAKVNALKIGCRQTITAGGCRCWWALGYAVEVTTATPPSPPTGALQQVTII